MVRIYFSKKGEKEEKGGKKRVQKAKNPKSLNENKETKH